MNLIFLARPLVLVGRNIAKSPLRIITTELTATLRCRVENFSIAEKLYNYLAKVENKPFNDVCSESVRYVKDQSMASYKLWFSFSFFNGKFKRILIYAFKVRNSETPCNSCSAALSRPIARFRNRTILTQQNQHITLTIKFASPFAYIVFFDKVDVKKLIAFVVMCKRTFENLCNRRENERF